MAIIFIRSIQTYEQVSIRPPRSITISLMEKWGDSCF